MRSFSVLINEENNALAEKAFEVAKEYVRRNPSLGLAVEPSIVVGNRSDAKAFLENGKDFYTYLIGTYLLFCIVVKL